MCAESRDSSIVLHKDSVISGFEEGAAISMGSIFRDKSY